MKWVVTVLVLMIAISCNDNIAPVYPIFSGGRGSQASRRIVDGTPQLIYSSSFESASDTVGWDGQGDWSIYQDAAPDGGTHCLYVQGCDVGPQAEKVLGAPTEESKIIFRFWAKCLERGGGLVRIVSLAPIAPYPTVGHVILDTVWTPYSDTSSFPAGYDLRIWIDGNGAWCTPILVDRIEILKIPK